MHTPEEDRDRGARSDACQIHGPHRQHYDGRNVDRHLPARIPRCQFYLGALPPLSTLSRFRGIHVDERLLVRVAHLWHTHAIRLAAHLWSEFRRSLRVRSFHTTPVPTPPLVFLSEHLSFLP
ncbi:hypothetical protein V8B97DRAFT_1598022 [Scleroderma yunnanense]